MGPFVPEFISDQLNLVVALLLGIAFGSVLEQAGFSSSRRLAGVFYGYDFTVLRVFFTAAVTAMIGVILLGDFGLLDTDAIFVNPTWLLPTIVGGAIMGLGFILGGYCPGTSICAAAIGKIDAMFFVVGGAIGVFLFGESYDLLHDFNESTFFGPAKVYESLGVSQGVFALGLILVAVLAFAVTTVIERRVAPRSAPSLEFRTRPHALAALVALALGGVVLVVPARKEHLVAKVSQVSYATEHPVAIMEADELAFRIVDRDPKTRIVDVRSSEAFLRQSLPGAVHVSFQDLFGKEWVPMMSQRHTKKVVVGATEEEGLLAGRLLQELGFENVLVLRGGMEGFTKVILESGTMATSEGRWEAVVEEFRSSSRTEILRRIEEQKLVVPKAASVKKKIKGGC